MKIAISGKGGVGKTTVCAIWAQLLAEDGLNVIAIDADSDTNLCSVFGIPAEQSPEPLIKMKQLIAERTGSGKDAVGAYFKLNPKVDDLPEKYCLKISGIKTKQQNENGQVSLKLLVLGAITQAGTGCACPESAFLKALLTHTILQSQEEILVDLAAGVEFMGRASIQGIDALVIVVEPGRRSIETAINIAKMGRNLGIKYIAAIVNKITDSAQTEIIEKQLAKADINVLANINYIASIQEADFERRPTFESSCELVDQLRKAKNTLINLISTGTSSKINAKQSAATDR